MRHTHRQTTTRTLTDLYRALDHQHAITITAHKEEKDPTGRKTGRLIETVRTLELDEIRTTRDGNILIIGMDRETRDTRAFRLDRIRAYTVSRSSYTTPRPEAASPAARLTIVRSTAQLVALELGRDYHPTTTASPLAA